ncbi:AAA family ATPase [Rugamonas sp. CCM 8940]|uniref:AAA family ATPase n=1 Tax=Rugamonas sp. CCM 8940 TaxID=2765359 RepID=UPI0018F31161|nr:AAA family ATPase [Rugamonas sp. CCM 8940]MBJ7311353.1 AAA family ATPase [Rugamonas sp. CCM 8940]
MTTPWLQQILFGPPGCGKSFHVRQLAASHLGIARDSQQLIETTFHPEYSYGDFLAKLLPHSGTRVHSYQVSGESVHLRDVKLVQLEASPTIEYRIHVGPLLKALALAYAGQSEGRKVLLAIDEINRGNCAQIFGDAFQLLDRDEHGWSEYGLELSTMFYDALKQEMLRLGKTMDQLPDQLCVRNADQECVGYKLRLPPNLSLIGTMNTSDESVYYMDTAFKRRWDFAFMHWHGHQAEVWQGPQGLALVAGTKHGWHALLVKLNAFIASSLPGRRIDDKQVGLWFIKSSKNQSPTPLQTLEKTLGQLLSKSAYSDWVAHFPSAEELGDSGLLRNDSIRPVAESLGVSWPFGASNMHAAGLAKALLPEVKSASNASTPPSSEISREAIRNKLMFFLWDNVFARDTAPLTALLQSVDAAIAEPRTFGEFATDENVDALLEGLMKT